MIAKIGDIFAVYEERLQQYAACQVIRIKEQASSRQKDLIAVLELDWHSDQLPTEDELGHIKPLICNYYFWNDRWDYCFVDANVPQHYRLVGNIPRLLKRNATAMAAGGRAAAYIGSSSGRRFPPSFAPVSKQQRAPTNRWTLPDSRQSCRQARYARGRWSSWRTGRSCISCPV